MFEWVVGRCREWRNRAIDGRERRVDCIGRSEERTHLLRKPQKVGHPGRPNGQRRPTRRVGVNATRADRVSGLKIRANYFLCESSPITASFLEPPDDTVV